VEVVVEGVVAVRDGQTSAHRPRLVVSHGTCPPRHMRRSVSSKDKLLGPCQARDCAQSRAGPCQVSRDTRWPGNGSRSGRARLKSHPVRELRQGAPEDAGKNVKQPSVNTTNPLVRGEAASLVKH
jgi:hypothetical protein